MNMPYKYTSGHHFRTLINDNLKVAHFLKVLECIFLQFGRQCQDQF